MAQTKAEIAAKAKAKRDAKKVISNFIKVKNQPAFLRDAGKALNIKERNAKKNAQMYLGDEPDWLRIAGRKVGIGMIK